MSLELTAQSQLFVVPLFRKIYFTKSTNERKIYFAQNTNRRKIHTTNTPTKQNILHIGSTELWSSLRLQVGRCRFFKRLQVHKSKSNSLSRCLVVPLTCSLFVFRLSSFVFCLIKPHSSYPQKCNNLNQQITKHVVRWQRYGNCRSQP